MNTLGVYTDHDAGVCVAIDGKIAAAISEERVNRVKASSGLSVETVMSCLYEGSLKPDDIDCICVAGYPGFNQFVKYAKQYVDVTKFTSGKNLIGLEYLLNGNTQSKGGFEAICLNFVLMTGAPKWYLLTYRPLRMLKKLMPHAKIQHFHHHEGHSIGAYYSSGFEQCLNIVIEGNDYDNCFVIEHFNKGTRKLICNTPWPHSPGWFYMLITQLLGFNSYTHPGKITGLAAYGNPAACMKEVARLMWTEGMTIRVHPDVFVWRARYASAKDKGRSWMPGEFKPYTKEDLAAAFQKRFEFCITSVIREALRLTGEERIALSGGCVANVRLNQFIYELPGVKEVFVMPPMGDVGQPIGLALGGCVGNGMSLNPRRLKDVYWGPEYSDNDIEKVLSAASLEYRKIDDMEAEVARLIHNGHVVARFNGRMEFGPRALGNRSVLFHTRDRTVNDWLNKRLGRTEFMPFAPSVLAEDRDDYFLNSQGAEYTARFMTITFSCTEKMKKECPAVVHVDGTARPHFVTRESNPGYYGIIEEYKRLSGIGMILNTSFNMHEEPIACTPMDAVRAFVRGHLDYLAIGNWLVAGRKNKD